MKNPAKTTNSSTTSTVRNPVSQQKDVKTADKKQDTKTVRSHSFI